MTSKSKLEFPEGYVTVVIRDETGWKCGLSIGPDSALTLIAVTSEDPQSVDEIAVVWPRYRTPVVPEFFSSLEFQEAEEAECQTAIQAATQWCFIDFVEKRLCTGGQMSEIQRDAKYSMFVEGQESDSLPMDIHLPPWWEITNNARVDTMGRSRDASTEIPRPCREILWGETLVADLAMRILEVFRSEAWQAGKAATEVRERYAFTMAVHRDWLMTPREDLQGRTPRQCLHGGVAWVDSLCDFQRTRIYAKMSCVAIPRETHSYHHAPPGRDEVCIYFDLCRELITAGWDWCLEAENDTSSPRAAVELQACLSEVQETWMNHPHEDGMTPQEIVEWNRRRAPLGSGFEVEGLSSERAFEHILDCDCPICAMMDSMPGPCFSMFDGHHLELDDEFAFSLWETWEEWNMEQAWVRAYDSEIQSPPCDETPQARERDEFSSVWDGINTDLPVIGASYLRLGFMLAEIINVLECDHAGRLGDADHDPDGRLPRRLTKLLSDFREANDVEKTTAAEALKHELEAIVADVPELTPRVADFQSHLDELLVVPRPELFDPYGGEMPL